jgi:polyisoprenoid-binding protein YceI
MQSLLVRLVALFVTTAGHAPAARTGDSVVYRLSHLSRLEVKTGKAGLFGFAGHEHMIRARGVSGRVVYFPDEPTSTRVEIRIATDSLEVMTPPDTAEIRKVTEAMRTEVLHVDQYPEMLFASRTLTAAEGGFRMTAALTMAGHTRPVSIDLRVTVGRDTIRATTTFDVNQTDFGIRPFRGGPGGTVRVADRVTFQIAAVAVR